MARPPKYVLVTGQLDEADDPSYPFKLRAVLSPPEFMQVAFVLMHGGSEQIVVRADVRRDLDEVVKRLVEHPRFRYLDITHPTLPVERIGRPMRVAL